MLNPSLPYSAIFTFLAGIFAQLRPAIWPARRGGYTYVHPFADFSTVTSVVCFAGQFTRQNMCAEREKKGAGKKEEKSTMEESTIQS